MAKFTRHSTLLNMRATYMLNSIHPIDKAALVDLLRSTDDIDRFTRDAIADALERQSGVRLELTQGRGTPASYTSRLATLHEYQEIAADVAQAKADDLPKPAAHVAANRRISIAKVRRAMRHAPRTFRIERVSK